MPRKTNKTDHVLSLLSGTPGAEEAASRKDADMISAHKGMAADNEKVQFIAPNQEDEEIADAVKQLLEEEMAAEEKKGSAKKTRAAAKEEEPAKEEGPAVEEKPEEEPQTETGRRKTKGSGRAGSGKKTRAAAKEEEPAVKEEAAEESRDEDVKPEPKKSGRGGTGKKAKGTSRAAAAKETVEAAETQEEFEEAVQAAAAGEETLEGKEEPEEVPQVSDNPPSPVQEENGAAGADSLFFEDEEELALAKSAEEAGSAAEANSAADEASGQDEREYEFINVMEYLVRERVLTYMEQFGNCTCHRCVADTIAVTLTHLQPKYVVVNKNAAAPLMNFYSQRFAGQVTVEITKACILVKENPHHNRN